MRTLHVSRVAAVGAAAAVLLVGGTLASGSTADTVASCTPSPTVSTDATARTQSVTTTCTMPLPAVETTTATVTAPPVTETKTVTVTATPPATSTTTTATATAAPAQKAKVGARAKTQSGNLAQDFLDAQAKLGPLQVTRVFYGALPATHKRISPNGTLEVISFKDGANLEPFVKSLTHGEMLAFYHEPEGPNDWASGAAYVKAWDALYDRAKAANPAVQFGMIAGAYQYRTAGRGYDGSFLPARADWYSIDTYRDGSTEDGFGSIVTLPNVAEFQRWYGLVKDRGKPLAITEYGRGTVGNGEVASTPAKRVAVLAPDVQWATDHGFIAFSQWFSNYGPDGRQWAPTDQAWYDAFNALPRG